MRVPRLLVLSLVVSMLVATMPVYAAGYDSYGGDDGEDGKYTTRVYVYDDAYEYLKKADRLHWTTNNGYDGSTRYTVGYPYIYENYYSYAQDDTREKTYHVADTVTHLRSNGQSYTVNGDEHTLGYDRRFSVAFVDSYQHCTGHSASYVQFSGGRGNPSVGYNTDYNLDNSMEIDYWQFIGWSASALKGTDIDKYLSVVYKDSEIRSDKTDKNLWIEGYDFANNDTAESRNLTAVDKEVITLKAVFSDLGIKYPAMKESLHTFLGWYTNPQVPTRKADGTAVFSSRGIYYGGGESIWNYALQSVNLRRNDGLRTIEADTVLYSWWNTVLTYIDLYDGLFYEGQDVSYNDLLRLIAVEDWEDDYKATLVTKYDKLLEELDKLYVDIDAEKATWDAAKLAYEQQMELALIEAERRNVELGVNQPEDQEDSEIEGEQPAQNGITAEDILYEWGVEQPDATIYDELMQKIDAIDNARASINAELTNLSSTASYIQGYNLVAQVKEVHYDFGTKLARAVDTSQFTDVSYDSPEGITIKTEDLTGTNWGTQESSENNLTLEYRENYYKDLKLDTSTCRINFDVPDPEFTDHIIYSGTFVVVYSTTDYGVSMSGFTDDDLMLISDAGVDTESLEIIKHEPITVTYSKTCKILYNDSPVILTNDTILSDQSPVLDSAQSVFDYLVSNQLAIDLQDIQSNNIWWSDKGSSNVVEHNKEIAGAPYHDLYELYGEPLNKLVVEPFRWWNINENLSSATERYGWEDGAPPNTNTRYHLQDRITIVMVKVSSVNEAFAEAHPAEARELYKLRDLVSIFGDGTAAHPRCKNFEYIEALDIVYDAFDQFGKYASGYITDFARYKGVVGRDPYDSDEPDDIPDDSPDSCPCGSPECPGCDYPHEPHDPDCECPDPDCQCNKDKEPVNPGDSCPCGSPECPGCDFPHKPNDPDCDCPDSNCQCNKVDDDPVRPLKEDDPPYDPIIRDDPGGPPEDVVNPQRPEERTATLYIVNSDADSTMIENYMHQNVRYIDEFWIDTIDDPDGKFSEGKSYFSVDGYGRDALQNAFDAARYFSSHRKSSWDFAMSYTNALGRRTTIHVFDYTSN